MVPKQAAMSDQKLEWNEQNLGGKLAAVLDRGHSWWLKLRQ